MSEQASKASRWAVHNVLYKQVAQRAGHCGVRAEMLPGRSCA